jgi:hypothetical protein
MGRVGDTSGLGSPGRPRTTGRISGILQALLVRCETTARRRQQARPEVARSVNHGKSKSHVSSSYGPYPCRHLRTHRIHAGCKGGWRSGTAMVRRLVRSDRAVAVSRPSQISSPAAASHNFSATRARARRDGDPAIRFCGCEVVSHTVCRAGRPSASVPTCSRMQGWIGCRTGAAAGGRQSTATQRAPQGMGCTSAPIPGHILLAFPDLVPCDTSSRASLPACLPASLLLACLHPSAFRRAQGATAEQRRQTNDGAILGSSSIVSPFNHLSAGTPGVRSRAPVSCMNHDAPGGCRPMLLRGGK